jgi:Ca-activated chloride channel family protein
MASFCPHIPLEATPPLALKILVDCSGSMVGSSLKAAQRALRQIVQQFDSEDRFALSRFGSTVEHPHADLMPATQVCRAQAQAWIDALQADMGGTEMEQALLSTFELDPTRSSDVLLITDGEIYQVEETIRSARLSGHRIFAVGIGSSPAYDYLRRLADATGGACEFVAPGEAVQAAMMRMFARMRSPRLTQLQLQWPQGPQPQWVTPLPLAAFSCDTITVYAHFDQPPQGAVQLMGQLSESRPLQAIGRIEIPTAVSTETTLPRMACAARIMATSRPHSMIQAEEVKALTELALTYQLVTAQTHFLLVHERAEEDKNTAAPAQHTIDHMLPAGWAGELSVKPTRRSSSRYFESRVIDYQPTSVLEWDQSTDAFNPLSRFVGLNPLGVCRWAQSRPAADWPNDLATLQNIGLGEWLVDWLSDTGTKPAWAHTTEAQRAHVFLSIMAWPDVLQALENNQSLPQALDLCQKALLSQIQMASPPEVARQQEGLIRDLCARMLTMSATAWPQEVFH